jgi:hypothetical protein
MTFYRALQILLLLAALPFGLLGTEPKNATAQTEQPTPPKGAATLAGKKCVGISRIVSTTQSLTALPDQYTVVQFADQIYGPADVYMNMEGVLGVCPSRSALELSREGVDDAIYNAYQQAACSPSHRRNVVNWTVGEDGVPFVTPGVPGGDLMIQAGLSCPTEPAFRP